MIVTLIPVTNNTIDKIYLVQVLLVICEKFSKSIKTLHIVALKYPLWYIKFPLSCVGQNDLYMYYICNVFV